MQTLQRFRLHCGSAAIAATLSPARPCCLTALSLSRQVSNACCSHPCLQAINKPVQIVECQYGRVPLEQLLGIEAFSLDKILAKEPDFLVCAPAQHAMACLVMLQHLQLNTLDVHSVPPPFRS